MNEANNYIVDSLEQHLFFARIMKEHALFLKVGFFPPGANLAREGERFLRQFDMLLSRVIALSNHVVRCKVLDSGEIVTEFTDCAERQTQLLTGTSINRDLTARELRLVCRNCEEFCATQAMTDQVRELNRNALDLVSRLIRYKNRVLQMVNRCNLFTANYPLLIEHILREARLYRANLLRLEGMCDDDIDNLRDSEFFWDRIMMEHALFIRGLLDPTEEKLIDTANDFAGDYRRLLDASSAANDKMLNNAKSLALTRQFRDFKRAGVEGIEGCNIRSIILPLLADHVLREANHYLRLLDER